MNDMTIREMMDMQKTLQRKYAGEWEPVCPDSAPSQLLWGVGEIGEMIDVIKKFGGAGIMSDPVMRRHFIEETGDVFMYLFDVLLCYGVTEEEFSEIYREKFHHNMARDYNAEHEKQREREAQGQ